MTPPRFVYDRGAAQCVWNDPLAEFAFDRVLTDRRSGEVTAELAVWLTSPTRALQHRGRVNLMSTRSRAEFANLLEKRAKGLDWAGMLEVASFRVVDASRKGRAPLILSTAQRPAMGANLFGPELPIPADDPVVFHGDGGDMKSFTALAIAASVASGRSVIDGLAPLAKHRVAYLDWEWTAWKHAERLRRLCPAGAPDILYVPCASEGPLSGQVDRLRDIFREHQITWAVVDSVALACAGPPEEAQVALDFFQSLSRLEVGSGLIAHTNRAGDVSRPFGSQFWHNSVRASWHVKAEKRQGGMVVTLTNKKRNDGPLCDPLTLAYTFSAEGVTVRGISASDAAQVAGGGDGSARDRMVAVLAQEGALTYHDLSAKSGIGYPLVKKLIAQHQGRTFYSTVAPGGRNMVTLAPLGTGTGTGQVPVPGYAVEVKVPVPPFIKGYPVPPTGTALAEENEQTTPDRSPGQSGQVSDEEEAEAGQSPDGGDLTDLPLAEGEEVAPWLSDLPDVAEGER